MNNIISSLCRLAQPGLAVAMLGLSLVACQAGTIDVVATIACTAERLCEEGSTCLGEICVPDKSLQKGETCYFSQQCEGELVCPGHSTFTCSDTCDTPYAQGACGPGAYCGIRGSTTACLPHKCELDDPTACGDRGKECVTMEDGVNDCVFTCRDGALCDLGYECREVGQYQEPVCLPAGSLPCPEGMVAKGMFCLPTP